MEDAHGPLDPVNRSWVDFLEHCSFCDVCDAAWIDAVGAAPQDPEPVCLAGRVLYDRYRLTRLTETEPSDAGRVHK